MQTSWALSSPQQLPKLKLPFKAEFLKVVPTNSALGSLGHLFKTQIPEPLSQDC